MGRNRRLGGCLEAETGAKQQIFRRYHDENTKIEDLTHPEDIEHFKKHEQLEAEEERTEKLTQQAIVEENIPSKFLRVQQA